MWMVGLNAEYQLGTAGDTTTRTIFTRMTPANFGSYPVVKFKCSKTNASYHTMMVLNANQDFYRWGYNGNYVLGTGNTTVKQTPLLMSGLTYPVVDFTTSGAQQYSSLIMLDSNGGVRVCGYNSYGELSVGNQTAVQSQTACLTGAATPMTDIIRIRNSGAASYGAMFYLRGNGQIYSAGLS